MGTATVTTVPDSGNLLIDSLAWGSAWTSGSGVPTVVQVGFYPIVSGTIGSGVPTAADVEAMMRTMETFERYINVDFQWIGPDSGLFADVRFVMAKDRNTLLGEATPPGELEDAGALNPGRSEIIIYKNNYNTPAGFLKGGGYDFVTFIHEFGHAVGLAHPHDNGGTATDPSLVFPGVPFDDPFGNYGDFNLNQGIFTTMSYNSGFEAGGTKPLNKGYGYEFTPMALDILALQHIYGANTTYASGDDSYVLPTANKSGTGYSCIWDTGGTDTIRQLGKAGCTIDLRGASGLVEEGGGGFVSRVRGVAGGFTIAVGAVIENAIGGIGADQLIGNDFENVLIGGRGKDNLTGNGGEDTFVFTSLKDSATTSTKADVITDFNAVEDQLDFNAIDANAKVIGAQDFDYIGDSTVFTSVGQIRSAVVNGDTIVYLNTDADQASELTVVLRGVLTLADENFIL